MVKQKGGKYQKGGMGAPGLGPVGMGAPGMGAPGMGAPGMGSSLFGLGQLGNQDPYRNGAWSGQLDYTHGAMNGLNSMLGAQPRF